MEIAVLTCQRVCFFQGTATRSRRGGDFLLARDIQSSNPTKYMYRQWRKKSSSRKEIKGRPFNIRNEFISSRVLTVSSNQTPTYTFRSNPQITFCTKSCKAFQKTAWTNRCALPRNTCFLSPTRATRLQNQRWTTHHASFTVPKKPKSYLCDTSSIRVRNSLSSDTALEIAQELLSSLHQQQQAYKNGGKISKASQSCATECMMVTRGKVCPQDHVENVILRF